VLSTGYDRRDGVSLPPRHHENRSGADVTLQYQVCLQRHRALLLHASCLHNHRPNRQLALDTLCKID
jgi:hypothetical protein